MLRWVVTFQFFAAAAAIGALVDLLWKGEWRVVVVGLAVATVGRLVLGLAVLIGGAVFGLPMALALGRGWLVLPSFFLLASHLYTHVLVAVWCFGVYIVLVGMVQPEALVSAAIWAYGVALTPWEVMAQAEERSTGDRHSGLIVGFAGAGLIGLAVSTLWLGWPIEHGAAILAGTLVPSVFVQLAVTWPILQGQRARPR
jgi:hypothetical protein